MTIDPMAIAETYLALWNEPDDARRRSQLAKYWTEDSCYVDPIMSGTGPDGIARMIGGALAQLRGYRFTLLGTPDGHGSYVRFSWILSPEVGAPIMGGTDIVQLDRDGRIAKVTGFLDRTTA